MMKLVRTLAAIAVTLAGAAPAARAGGDIEVGRTVAEQHCSRCHVVGDYNKYGGIGSTPSFQLLANRFPDYKERFETFFARRPHTAFVSIEGVGRLMPELPPNAAPVTLPMSAVADVLAFVETLREKR
jgi:hypothetical protein